MKKLVSLILVLAGIVGTASAEVKIKGSWDGWTEHTMTNTSGSIYSISLTLSGTGDFEFGIDVDGSFYKNNGTMYWYNCTNWVFETSANNCKINLADTGSGSYTFVWDNSEKKLSVTYPNLETVYFYNNHNWPNVFVYFLGSSYWDSDKGSGSNSRKNAYEMTQIGTSGIYQFTYPTSFSSAYIAFLKNRQDGYDNFDNTEGVYKEDFNHETPLYYPNTTDPENKNYRESNKIWTAYWNKGAWYSYSAPSSAYSRTGLTIGNFGTICLPYAATVEGATVYEITNKIVESEVLKGINIEPVVSLEAGKTYIFKATSTTLTATLSGNFTGAVTGGMMEGNLASARKAPMNSYVIGGKEIHEVIGDGVNVGQYKGWIIMENVPVAPTSARSADFISFADSETTAIETVKQDVKANGEYFNLAGQRVAQPTKGLYIVNGKKVIMK